MQVSIINDCCDENAKLRQISKVASVFGDVSVNSFAITSDLEAAGFLVDALDSFEEKEGVVLVNFARRNGSAKKWKNGTPFGYFWLGKTLVVSSVDGFVLSLCKKLDLIKEFYLFDIEEVLSAIDDKEVSKEEKKRIINTQFRSLNFLPRVANWVWNGYNLPKSKYELENITDVSGLIWFVDNFGNIKTTITREEADFLNGSSVRIKLRGSDFCTTFYDRLKDLPDSSFGLIEGSSGIGEKRFLEVVFQGGSAASKLDLRIGDSVEI